MDDGRHREVVVMTTNIQDPDLRDRAMTSLRKKREFLSHLRPLPDRWDVYAKPPSEARIRPEMERLDDR